MKNKSVEEIDLEKYRHNLDKQIDNYLDAGYCPHNIYLIIGWQKPGQKIYTIIFSIAMANVGQKLDVSRLVIILQDFLKEKNLFMENDLLVIGFSVPEEMSYHQVSCGENIYFFGPMYYNKIWLHSLISLELLPKLGAAVDIGGSCN
jgi:hypothetical protein